MVLHKVHHHLHVTIVSIKDSLLPTIIPCSTLNKLGSELFSDNFNFPKRFNATKKPEIYTVHPNNPFNLLTINPYAHQVWQGDEVSVHYYVEAPIGKTFSNT